MKNTTKYFLLMALCVYCSLWQVRAQTSTNTVKYQVTYDAPTTTYMAWVIPGYSVPNANNTTSTEKGATAQFTIVVPKDFVITSITDITGTWTKTTESAFIRLGPGNPNQNFPGLDPSLNYYVIGKTANETDYGTFAPGVPIPLFSFKGNGCFGPIKPLPPGDPFIASADNLYSLNVGNSFYSRSGQGAGGNVVPREQFIDIIGGSANCITPPATADLMITKVLEGSKTRALGATVSYRVVVYNAGPGAATNVVVKDSVGMGVALLSGTVTKGTFSNGLWNIPQIASGDSAVLTISAQIQAQGVSFNYAMIKQADQPDNNLTNNKAVACVTVPILLCSGQTVEATVPASYTNVVWFLNGQQVGTGNVFAISKTGTYTYTASNATCPADGCCPLIVLADENCCPPQICVPVSIVRKRSDL